MYFFYTNYFNFFQKNSKLIFSLYFFFIFFLFWYFGFLTNAHRWEDGYEYIARAEKINIFSLDFSTLSDGFRTPLYPLILNIFSIIFPYNLTILAKSLNVLILILLPIVLYYLSQKNSNELLKKIYFLKINLLLFFFPNFYFADLVYAEVLTIFFFNIYIFYLLSLLLEDKFKIKKIIISCVLFVILFYLKANLLLISFCFCILIIYNFKKNFKFLFLASIISIILVLPWFIYMYNLTGQLKASNCQYVNRLFGMGFDVINGNNLNTLHGSFLNKSYRNNKQIYDWYNLYRTQMDEKILIENRSISIKENLKREKFSKISVERIWSYDSKTQIIYSFLKIPHLFGLNLRDAQDYLVLIYFFIICYSIFFIKKEKKLKVFLYLNLCVLIPLLVQTFLYVPTLRYSIYLMNSCLLILSAFILMTINKYKFN